MKYFDLLVTAFDCALYGLLMTVVTMLLLYFILKFVSNTCVKTIPFYLTGIVLAPLLLVQDTLLAASIEALSLVKNVELDVQHIVGTYTQAMDMYQTTDVLQTVGDDFPLIGWFANITNLEVSNAPNLATELSDMLKDFLTKYIWKRIGWYTAFIVVAVLIALLADKRGNGYGTCPTTARHTGSTTSHKDYDNF